jgi:hypothetical protein
MIHYITIPTAFEDYYKLDNFCRGNCFKINTWVNQNYGSDITLEYNTEEDRNRILKWNHDINEPKRMWIWQWKYWFRK